MSICRSSIFPNPSDEKYTTATVRTECTFLLYFSHLQALPRRPLSAPLVVVSECIGLPKTLQIDRPKPKKLLYWRLSRGRMIVTAAAAAAAAEEEYFEFARPEGLVMVGQAPWVQREKTWWQEDPTPGPELLFMPWRLLLSPLLPCLVICRSRAKSSDIMLWFIFCRGAIGGGLKLCQRLPWSNGAPQMRNIQRAKCFGQICFP